MLVDTVGYTDIMYSTMEGAFGRDSGVVAWKTLRLRFAKDPVPIDMINQP